MNNINKLFEKYNELCEKNKLEYQPDGFLVLIHEHYLKNNKIQLPYPLYATWDITNYCNLRCVFCSASAIGKKGEIDDDNTIVITKKLINNGIKYVSIRGGEPTLVKQLYDCVKLFNDNNVFVEIVSNGSGITNDFVSKLKKLNYNLIRLKISLDCTDKDINDKLRGNGSFEYATSAMKVCRKHSFPFRTQMVITNLNKSNIIDMYNFVSNLKATSFGTMLVLPMGRARKSELVKINEQLLKDLIYIKENENNTKLEKLGMGIDGYRFYDSLYKNSNFSEEDSYNFSILKCNCGKTRINIDSNGDIYPCDMMKYPEFKMGNIIHDSVDDFWNSESVKKFNMLSRRTKTGCKDCKVKGCNTGCFGISYGIYKSIEHSKPNCRLYDD